MTTPKAPAGKSSKKAGDASGATRAVRTPPAREAPHRGYAPRPEPEPGSAPGRTPDGVSTSEAIASAVKLGYDVIGQNIEQGREAAHRFRAGTYSVREAPQDLGRLAARMLALTRELSTTTFDVLERIIQDPNLVGAVREASGGHPPGGSKPDRPVAPPFYSDGGSPGTAPDVPSAKKKEEGPAPPADASLPLTCEFTSGQGLMRGGTLARPETPAFLVVPALGSVDPDVPLIREVNFEPAETGDGVVAKIAIPLNQPPGLYSGVICAWDTKIVLGVLTIEVLK